MRYQIGLYGGTALALALTMATWGTAQAADADAGAKSAEVSEIVVTGSLIKGSAEDAALPVDVISSEDLQKQGSPTALELIKDLSVSSGVLGDTNQFDARAQGSEGSGSINLRGLGPQRTLVLINGRRMTPNPFGQTGTGIVDTNLIPSVAVGRVEVLKDGAAATYGSDAIAGVVNFIMRKNFDGLEASASYKLINGSDGDYTGGVVWGVNFDRANLLVTAGYQHRSVLSTLDRDFAIKSITTNPQGGWSGGNGTSVWFPTIGSTIIGAGVLDNGCAALGGVPGAGPACNFHFTPYDNLVEQENRYQLYSQLDVDLSDTTKFHGDVLYAKTDVPQWRTSPSYLALQSPNSIANGGVSPGPAGGYYVPASNPGYAAYLATNPGAFSAAATGAWVPGVRYRPYGLGGNPLFDNGASRGSREFEAYRVSGGLSGEFGGGIGYDVAVTYSQETGIRQGWDTMVDRFQLALRGYGSLNSGAAGGCDSTETAGYTTNAGNNAIGCYYFNPFSNGVKANPITGQTNPNYNAALSNSADLTAWFFKKGTTKSTQRLFVVDALLNGKFAWTLGGGDASWAVGSQYRRDYYVTTNDDLFNLAANPCIDTPYSGTTNCAVRNGPFMFLGGGSSADLQSDVYALFGEVQLPFTDKFSASVAARYEDYRGQVGSTFNPKISAKYEITPWLAIRGSAGSTFRGPPQTNLNAGFVTSLQFLAGSFRAIDIYSNPKLEPEKAKTYNVGFLVKEGGLKASLDYWRFDFDNPIVAEGPGDLFNTLFPTGAGTGNCGAAGYAGLQSRFSFSGNGACSASNISRLKTLYVNGARIETSGLDLIADWRFEDVFGGSASIGTTATYTLAYKTQALTVEGVTVAPAFDAVGKLNYQTTAYPLPQLKGSLYGEYRRGPHNIRLTMNYLDGYTDQRTAVTGFGKQIHSSATYDLAYRALLPWNTTFVAAVDNILDSDPPFARLDLNYDPFTGNAIGRTVKVSVTKKF